ncbi:MAG: hypothetical protein PHH31_09570 [Acidaminococcaceae bacterium]|nr:hypothetical protein [Acidaminococcaceae bacterium]MDD4721642.1 hypothetical protein [Acidaminococcaceae bacterium]
MNKILKYLMLGVLAVCFTAPVAAKVEAAKIAVVPLIVNVEDEGGMNAILYSEACSKQFTYPEFDFVDTDLVKKAVAAQKDVFSKAGMQAIMDATGADIVMAMSVDKFDWMEDRMRQEPVTKLDFSGKFATLNRLTGKYKSDHWSNTNEMESEAISPRSDWPHAEFARTVRQEIKKAAK